MRLRHVLRHIRQAEAGERRIEHLESAVEDELAFNPHLELAGAFSNSQGYNWFPPGEKHWHGATPTTAMTHIAIQEAVNGKNVEWMEKVRDEQYRG
jgi:hypothetical protein